jgi:ribosomal protein S27AE
MISKQTKHDGYELQGVAMGIKALIVSLVEYPDQLQSKSDVIGQVKTDLAKLNELAASILVDISEKNNACPECGLVEGCHTLHCSLDEEREQPRCEACGVEVDFTSYGDVRRYCGSYCEQSDNR